MRILPIIASFVTAAFCAPNYQLVWNDEFDYSGTPNPAKWDYDVGGNGWGNGELQFYKRANPKNAYASNGEMKLTVHLEDTSWTSGGSTKTSHFSSTRMVTRGKQAWKYGKFEARMKLPRGRGMWPAFWLIPTTNAYGGWPNSGEIDVMENYAVEPTVMHGSAHTKNNYAANCKTGWALAEVPNDSFHIYSLDWRPDTLTISVDGRPYFQYTNPKTGSAAWPFDQDFYIILNVAVNGTYGDTLKTETRNLPQSMTLDWVRVYQDPAVSGGVITLPPPPATYTMAINQTAGGTISVSPSKSTYNSGEKVQIKAVANSGYAFSSWIGANSTLAIDSLTISGNISLSAAFKQVTQTPISVSLSILQSAGGTVTVSPSKASYALGEKVQILAVASNGYSFANWVSGANSSLAVDSLVLDADKTLKAQFTQGTVSTPDQFLTNGDFSQGWTGWTTWNDESIPSTFVLRDGMACIRPGGIGGFGWHTQMTISGFPVTANVDYQILFTAKASAKRLLTIFLSQANSPFGALTARPEITVDNNLTQQSIILTAGMTDASARLEMNFAMDTAEVCLDNISVGLAPPQTAGVLTNRAPSVQIHQAGRTLSIRTSSGAAWTLRSLNGNLIRSGSFAHAGTNSIEGLTPGIGILTVQTPEIKQSFRVSTF